jgi:hypothetical protein
MPYQERRERMDESETKKLTKLIYPFIRLLDRPIMYKVQSRGKIIYCMIFLPEQYLHVGYNDRQNHRLLDQSLAGHACARISHQSS